MSSSLPVRSAVLSTYRQLLRSSNPIIDSTRVRPYTLKTPWARTVGNEYRKYRNCSDPEVAWNVHNLALDYLAMNVANAQHAESMFAAGWCLKKPQVAQVKNVAGYVGLDMPVVFGRNELLPDLPITLDDIADTHVLGGDKKLSKLTLEKPTDINREDQLKAIEEAEERRRAERRAMAQSADTRGYSSSFGSFTEEGIESVMGVAGMGPKAGDVFELAVDEQEGSETERPVDSSEANDQQSKKA